LSGILGRLLRSKMPQPTSLNEGSSGENECGSAALGVGGCDI
jgi:hypothetical protein